MESGQLNQTGIANLSALQHLIRHQQLQYPQNPRNNFALTRVLHACIHVHARARIRVHWWTGGRMHTHPHACTHAHAQTCVCGHTCRHTHAYVGLHTHMCMGMLHAHTLMHARFACHCACVKPRLHTHSYSVAHSVAHSVSDSFVGHGRCYNHRYDFQYYKMDYDADMPVLVLSVHTRAH